MTPFSGDEVTVRADDLRYVLKLPIRSVVQVIPESPAERLRAAVQVVRTAQFATGAAPPAARGGGAAADAAAADRWGAGDCVQASAPTGPTAPQLRSSGQGARPDRHQTPK